MAFRRLGLDSLKIPYTDRHGLIFLKRGNLYVEDGNIKFQTAGDSNDSTYLPPGTYTIPVQTISLILVGPGCTISHDTMRIASNYNVGLLFVGDNGVRLYASLPSTNTSSKIARVQAELWANETTRKHIAIKMFSMRFLEDLSLNTDVLVLRGMEGHKAKKTYELIASRYGIKWDGRRYNRNQPTEADLPNQAINHVATITEGAAYIAVNAVSAIPQLGFIHEDANISFVLDIADLFRDSFTIPVAFQAVQLYEKQKPLYSKSIDYYCRYLSAMKLSREEIIPSMIDKIKELICPSL
jgi:CRISPR-associated protein Cas1